MLILNKIAMVLPYFKYLSKLDSYIEICTCIFILKIRIELILRYLYGNTENILINLVNIKL